MSQDSNRFCDEPTENDVYDCCGCGILTAAISKFLLREVLLASLQLKRKGRQLIAA